MIFRLFQALARAILALRGWRIEGELAEKRAVIVAGPHTSNWDYLFLELVTLHLGVRLRWLGKHTIFRPPVGWVARWLGGIPVQRGAPQKLVLELVQMFDENERLIVLFTPEGSRGYRDHWKSGFLHVARAAGVPILAAAIHYPKRLVRIREPLDPETPTAELMATLRSFYRDSCGRYPDQAAPVRLRREDEDRAVAVDRPKCRDLQASAPGDP